MTSTRWRARVPLLALLVVGIAACGSSGSDESGAPDEPDERTTAFCAEFLEVLPTGDNARLMELLAQGPPEVARLNEAAERAEQSGDVAAVTAAGQELMVWLEVTCRPEVAVPGGDPEDRRVAPPLGSLPDEVAFCIAFTGFPVAEDAAGGAVYYGGSSNADPYTGPMLGIVWGPAGEEDPGGDGDQTPVQVRGTTGVAAPITVFQQVVVEELGTLIAWQEGGLSVQFYGRSWELGRTAELVALADQLEYVDGAFRLPAAALPPGYEEVVAAGNPKSVASPVYEVFYQAAADEFSSVILNASLSSPAEFEAFRFFTLDTERTTIGGREVIAGNTWSETGPAVVTWREPDGLVVRLFGGDLETLRDMAEATRELTRDEWLELVGAKDDCPELMP